VQGGRADGQTVFAGHGEYRLGSGEVTVPEGTTIKFYAEDGEGIVDSVGLKVELGEELAHVEAVGPGGTVLNYTLMAPKDLKVASGSVLVEDATDLAELLKPGMGIVHWASCRKFGARRRRD